jgi:hypothetical protein
MAVPTDNIETTTLRLIRRRMADNIFKANPTGAWLLMRGRVKTAPGGRFIAEPLMYTTNQTVQSYRGYDRLNVAPTEEVTEAQYNWRMAAISISISGEEELMNAGPEQIFDLLRVKIRVAEMSFRQWFDEKLHAATASKDLTKDFLGLDEMIDDQLNYSTVGAIDGNVETWWQNQIGPGGDGVGLMPGGTGSGEADDPVHITATSTTELTNLLNRMYHNTAKGSADKTDLILMSQEVFERYEADALDKRRLQDNDLADLGFENIKFKGARMMWNENMKEDSGDADLHPIYFLNSEFLSFTLHQRRNFVISSFVSPWDQDARVAQILLAGQLTMNNRRRQGVTWVDLSP